MCFFNPGILSRVSQFQWHTTGNLKRKREKPIKSNDSNEWFLEANEIKEDNTFRSNDTGLPHPNTLSTDNLVCYFSDAMWLRKVCLLHLPLAGDFWTRWDSILFETYHASICIHMPSNCAGPGTHASFAQFTAVWPPSAFTFASASLYVQPHILHISIHIGHAQQLFWSTWLILTANICKSYPWTTAALLVHRSPLCRAMEPCVRRTGGSKCGMFSPVDCRWHDPRKSTTQVIE